MNIKQTADASGVSARNSRYYEMCIRDRHKLLLG